MKLFYWKSPSGNFGDDLNEWLWDTLLPGWRSWEEDRVLVGVGTILNTEILPASPKYLVVGSGSGFGNLPTTEDPSVWDIRFVRGPLTAQRLGLGTDRYATDPAALIPRIWTPKLGNGGKTGIYIPHCHSDVNPLYDWARICDEVGVRHVSSRSDARSVIAEIANAEFVVTESMHGAILADTFRVPWVATSQVPLFNQFKWRDWGLSIGITPHISPLASWPPQPGLARRALNKLRRKVGIKPLTVTRQPSSSEAEKINETLAKSLKALVAGPFQLSDQATLNRQLDKAEEYLQQTQKYYGVAGS